MKIIVGLGNPGFRYRNTRHNAGFLVLNALAKKYRINIKKKSFQGIYGVGSIMQQEVMLFEPLTYMNLSGSAVKAVCSSRLEEQEDLLVVSDDFNLPLGRIRLREQGSAGGHNGLGSIIGLAGPDFARLRIGVGREAAIEDMSAYVLAAFSGKERAVLKEVIPRAVECIEAWISGGIKKAMGEYNQ